MFETSLEKKYDKFVTKERLLIPKRYNHIELVDELPNKDIDWFVSVSNRSDGKSFNYINFFIDLALEFDIKFMLLARHYTLRQAYASFMYKIYEKSVGKKTKDLLIKRTEDYMLAYNKDKPIGLITDLNNATDLKYHSNFLQEYPLMRYDEFLAIEGDYLPDEWERLKTIYESVDRNEDIPLIHTPKIFLLGNAVNFSSPLLANLDLFNRLEKHPINTVKQYGNIVLEMRRNENANEIKNTRAFKTENDEMNLGQFVINNYRIATDLERNVIRQKSEEFYIKLRRYFMKVEFVRDEYSTSVLLSIVANAEDYLFTMNIKDINKNSIYLKESFYSENQVKKYEMGRYLFDNAYSRDFITSDPELVLLKVQKCINQYIIKNEKAPDDLLDKKATDRYLELTKKSIARKFFE